MVKVFLDSSNYCCYRVGATLAWWRRARPEVPPTLDNAELLEAMESQFWKHLEQFCKRYGVHREEIYNIRDCPIDTIWRLKVAPEYKAHRSAPAANSGEGSGGEKIAIGPFVKRFNELHKDTFRMTLRVPGAEADDIIATLVLACDPGERLIVISNDSDFEQLWALHPGVELLRPRNWEPVPRPGGMGNGLNVPLWSKILAGDSTDNIPPYRGGCGPATAMGLLQTCGTETALINHLQRQDPEGDSFGTMLRNRRLVDCTYCPAPLRRAILTAAGWPLGSLGRGCEIQLGLCCINTLLQRQKIFCSRKPILASIASKGLAWLQATCLQNCRDLLTMVHWNGAHGIRVFRMSSELFPHYQNKRAAVQYDLDFAQPLLTEIGAAARSYGMRLTFHPGQFHVLATPNQETYAETLLGLGAHAEILDRLGCDESGVMVIHGGGIYGDKAATKQRWAERYATLPGKIRRRLVLENCEKCFSIVDCLEVSAACGVPVVLDTHHFDCYRQAHPGEAFNSLASYLPAVLATWGGRKPKFHVSEQAPEGPLGKHSDYVECLPPELLTIPRCYGVEIDIMIEAKEKEQALFHLYQRYPHLDLRSSPPLRSLTTPVVTIRRGTTVITSKAAEGTTVISTPLVIIRRNGVIVNGVNGANGVNSPVGETSTSPPRIQITAQEEKETVMEEPCCSDHVTA